MSSKQISHWQMRQRAKALCNLSTPAERKLWQYLCRKQLNNLKFRRQHVIGPFIVDFYCPQKKLIIEVDGGTHIDNQIYDKKRERYLESKGYHVIRYLNTEVVHGTADVLEKIIFACWE